MRTALFCLTDFHGTGWGAPRQERCQKRPEAFQSEVIPHDKYVHIVPPLTRSIPQPTMPAFVFAMRCEQVPGPTAKTNLLHKIILIMCSMQVCALSFGRGGEVEVPLHIEPGCAG